MCACRSARSALSRSASAASCSPASTRRAGVRAADVKHTDGTFWYQGGVTMALWTLAASGVTVFKILANNAKNTLRPLYEALNGILVSDRAKALNFWAMAQRQICWAHLCCANSS